MENKEGRNIILELYKALDDKFAKDIVIMEIGELTPIADFFVIATGGNAPQIAALAETAEKILKPHGIRLHHTEGMRSGNWVLLDFGTIILHLFDKETRDYYDLERIWRDAKTVTP